MFDKISERCFKNSKNLKMKFQTMCMHADASKAKRDLDFKLTISAEEGIPRTVEWFKKLYGKQSAQ